MRRVIDFFSGKPDPNPHMRVVVVEKE